MCAEHAAAVWAWMQENCRTPFDAYTGDPEDFDFGCDWTPDKDDPANPSGIIM